jgi:hypothetical protein
MVACAVVKGLTAAPLALANIFFAQLGRGFGRDQFYTVSIKDLTAGTYFCKILLYIFVKSM